MSKLVGDVAGPTLKVDNNSAEVPVAALDLQVEPGKAPMKVNSDGRVANFNADKLDGKGASALLDFSPTSVNHRKSITRIVLMPDVRVGEQRFTYACR